MLLDLEQYSPANAKPTLVMDAGIASEDNLKPVVEKGYRYVCVSGQQVKEYEMTENQLVVQPTNRNSEQVKLGVFSTEGFFRHPDVCAK